MGGETDDGNLLPKQPQWLAWLCILAGPVLFSSTRPERAQVAAEAAILSAQVSDTELAKITEFAVAVRRACAEMSGTA